MAKSFFAAIFHILIQTGYRACPRKSPCILLEQEKAAFEAKSSTMTRPTILITGNAKISIDQDVDDFVGRTGKRNLCTDVVRATTPTTALLLFFHSLIHSYQDILSWIVNSPGTDATKSRNADCLTSMATANARNESPSQRRGPVSGGEILYSKRSSCPSMIKTCKKSHEDFTRAFGIPVKGPQVNGSCPLSRAHQAASLPTSVLRYLSPTR